MSVPSFAIVEMVLEEADRMVGERWPGYKIVDEYVSILKEYCEAIDSMIEEFGGDGFAVKIDETDLTVHISVRLESAQAVPGNTVLNDLIKRSLKFSASYDDGEYFVAKFIFPPLWEGLDE